MLRKVRIILALAVLLCTSLLFLDFTGSIHSFLGWLAQIQFVPALLALNLGVVAVLVLLTFIFGRVYCSVICPLGIFQDGIIGLKTRLKKKNRFRFRWKKAANWLRYLILALFVIALVAPVGGFIASLLDPYSNFGRIMSNVFAPFWQWGNNALAYVAERVDSYAFYEKSVWLKSLPTFLVALIVLAVIVALAWNGGRDYCNKICPVGSLLGLVSRFSLLAVRIDSSKCNGCSLCEHSCKSSCIDSKAHKVDGSRCVVCFNCLENCHHDALSYGWRYSRKKSVESAQSPENRGRRAFVAGTLLAAGSAGLSAAESATLKSSEIKRGTPLKPAGAVSLKHFTRHCTACQLCVSVCPNNVLRPSGSLESFMQPEMSYERGYCRPECTKCSQVCPNDAILKIEKEEKSSIQIGCAVVDTERCVVITDNVSCGNCARKCPSGAIKMVRLDPEDAHSRHIPAVNEERCIGCGACEYLCPAKPQPAIHVEGLQVHRKL